MYHLLVPGLMSLLLTAPAIPASAAETVPSLIEQWQNANGECRGSSNPKIYERACDRRLVLDKKLHLRGWCYGMKNQAGYQYRWHRCTSQSERYSEG